MDLFAILRRDGWQSADELELAAQRSSEEGERRGDVRWIRSYVLEEDGGSLGTVCIYEAESEQAIREHAGDAGLPVNEVIKVADTVIVRPDPESAATT
jgi:sporulation protein YlmC with PRC-barrel domain